jgi:hypothetical protein
LDLFKHVYVNYDLMLVKECLIFLFSSFQPTKILANSIWPLVGKFVPVLELHSTERNLLHVACRKRTNVKGECAISLHILMNNTRPRAAATASAAATTTSTTTG